MLLSFLGVGSGMVMPRWCHAAQPERLDDAPLQLLRERRAAGRLHQ
jgi:hypothetical protein